MSYVANLIARSLLRKEISMSESKITQAYKIVELDRKLKSRECGLKQLLDAKGKGGYYSLCTEDPYPYDITARWDEELKTKVLDSIIEVLQAEITSIKSQMEALEL